MPGVRQDGTTTTYPYDFSVPQIFTVPTINVRTAPDDVLSPIENPFHTFHFPSKAMKESDWRVSAINVSSFHVIPMNRTLIFMPSLASR